MTRTASAVLLAFLLVPVLASADSTHISNGPFTNWSYGWKTSPTGSFTPFTSRTLESPGYLQWTDGVQNYPSIRFNNTNTRLVSGSTYRFPRNQLMLHPDSTGRMPVVRWTADGSGTYQIQGLFAGLDSYGYRTVFIVVNSGTSATVVNQTLSGASVNPFSLSYTLAFGDTVDFVVSDGGNGYGFDSTGLSAIITEL